MTRITPPAGEPGWFPEVSLSSDDRLAATRARTMMDERRLAHVLDLHEKSYARLLWVKASLKAGRLSFAVAHNASDSEAAAREWITRHLGGIPTRARPEPPDIPTFARLFVSFLKTSFRLNPNAVRAATDCGCWCTFCTYLQEGPNLDPRTPSKKHAALAFELKRFYLSRLAADASPGAVDTVLGRADLREDVALATWGFEMLRRSEFASQGEAVLVLWREFAWEGGRPTRDFRVTARAVVAAERRAHDALVAA